MAHYSIKDLEKLSGIKAHTIRIWEKRYNLISPQRTDTNIRVYSSDDLKQLLNVAFLNHNGLKISKIALLTNNEILERVLQLSSNVSNVGNQIDNLVTSMVSLNEDSFESILNNQIKQFGMEEAFIKVISPFLVKIGVLWQTGNIHPAQEHFVSNIIKRKLMVAIDQLKADDKKPKIIMFLPEGEYHELGLLFYAYLLKNRGFVTIYLGQSVPLDDLVEVQSAYNVDYLFTSFVTTLHHFTFNEYVQELSKAFKKQKIYIPGSIIQKYDFKKAPNIIKIKSPEHFLEMIRKIK